MNKAGKVLGCLLIVFAILLQFGTNTAMAHSGKVNLKVNQVIKKNKKIEIKMTVSNNTNKEISVGSGVVVLQKRINNKWKKIKQKKNVASTSLAYVLEGGKKKKLIYNLMYSYKKSELKKGKYRIGMVINNKIKYSKFVI